MLNALRSGGFNLQMSETSSILSFVMNIFNRFINSNEELKLDQGFQVFFKVFSYNHLHWPKSRRNQNQNQRTLGCQQDNSEVKIAGCVTIASGFPGDDLAFQNKCLLSATIVCFFANLFFANNKCNENFETLIPLWTKQSSKKKKIIAGKFLQTEIFKLIDKLQLPIDGPYNISTTIPKLCDHFNSQIHVIKSTQEMMVNIESFPTPEWKNDTLQIFLFQTEPGHVVPVINLKKYVNQNHQLCLLCKKTFSRNYRHVCTVKQKSCFLCKSYFATETTIVQANLPFAYCFSKLDPTLAEPLTCKLCNYKFSTERCFSNHQQICGIKSKQSRIGFFCDTCNKFFKWHSTMTTKEDHKCLTSFQKICKHCKEMYDQNTNHQCHLEKEHLSRSWPKLCFFSFEFQNNSTFQCNACQQLRKEFKEIRNLNWKEALIQKEFFNLKCDHHQKNTLFQTPNFCTLWRETESGKFDEQFFADDKLKLKNEITTNVFQFDYDVHNKNPLSKKRFTGKQTEATKSSLQKLVDKDEKSVLDYFTMFLLSPDAQNATFLSLNNCNENMATVINCLLKLDWPPTLIKKGNTFILMQTKCQNLLFLNASNYFKGDYVDLVQQFEIDEEAYFFPQK